MKRIFTSPFSLFVGLATVAACGGQGDPVPVDVDDESTSAGTLVPDLEDDASQPAAAAAGAAPTSFVSADVGGWQLGEAVAPGTPDIMAEASDGRADTCGSILTGVLRDIRESHP